MAVAHACPLSAKRGCEGFLLLRSRELGNQQSVADRDLVFQKYLGHWRYEISESNTTILCSLHSYVVFDKSSQPARRDTALSRQHNWRLFCVFIRNAPVWYGR
jgi:hypothetical protein